MRPQNTFLFLILMSCAAADPVPTSDPVPVSTSIAIPESDEPILRFWDIAAGSWGFQVKDASCEDNPHTISFSDGGMTMKLRYAKSLNENPPTEATYRVLAEGPGYLRMAMEGETRTTDAGVPVIWDMVLLNANSYCWHRTDWQPGGCTQPATRCPGGKTPN